MRYSVRYFKGCHFLVTAFFCLRKKFDDCIETDPKLNAVIQPSNKIDFLSKTSRNILEDL